MNDTEESKLKNTTNNLLNIVEPATLLTITIGLAYFIGWSYTDFYCHRIGSSHLSLNLPTTYYLIQGFTGAIFLSFLINFFQIHSKDAPKTFLGSFLINSIAIGSIIMNFIYDLFFYNLTFYSLLFIFIPLILIIGLSYFQKSIVHFVFEKHSLGIRYLVLVAVFFLIIFKSYLTGTHAAENTIEGKSGIIINLFGKESLPLEIEGKPFILILHNDAKYFVVEKAIPAPENPTVYIIPDDK